jgi:hypothetical protein
MPEARRGPVSDRSDLSDPSDGPDETNTNRSMVSSDGRRVW